MGVRIFSRMYFDSGNLEERNRVFFAAEIRRIELVEITVPRQRLSNPECRLWGGEKLGFWSALNASIYQSQGIPKILPCKRNFFHDLLTLSVLSCYDKSTELTHVSVSNRFRMYPASCLLNLTSDSGFGVQNAAEPPISFGGDEVWITVNFQLKWMEKRCLH